MIKRIVVKNYLGEELELSFTNPDPDHGLLIKSIEGLTSPKATINSINFATMDGAVFNSARLDPRTVQFTFLLKETPTIEAARQRIYKHFPIKREVLVLIETDHRKAIFKGNVESTEGDLFTKQQEITVGILCSDPYMYGIRNDRDLSLRMAMFEFPFSNESLTEPLIEFSQLRTHLYHEIEYDGDMESGFVIILNVLGEFGNLTIYNAITKDKMKINVQKIKNIMGSIKIGDQIIINSERNSKSVSLIRNGVSYNIINGMDLSSDWLTFHKGHNIIVCVPESGPENLHFTISNRVIYEGI